MLGYRSQRVRNGDLKRRRENGLLFGVLFLLLSIVCFSACGKPGPLKSVTDKRLILNTAQLHDIFRKEGFRIFAGKGYTSTGVSAAVCRIASAISADSREIFPVSSVLEGEYGVYGTAVSVPSILGRNGIEEIREVLMTEEEREAFLSSVEIVRKAAMSEGIV